LVSNRQRRWRRRGRGVVGERRRIRRVEGRRWNRRQRRQARAGKICSCLQIRHLLLELQNIVNERRDLQLQSQEQVRIGSKMRRKRRKRRRRRRRRKRRHRRRRRRQLGGAQERKEEEEEEEEEERHQKIEEGKRTKTSGKEIERVVVGKEGERRTLASARQENSARTQ